MMRYLFFVAAVLFSLTISGPAKAHPHVWADIRVQVEFNDEGLVTGLRQTWLFDDFYSAFVIGGGVGQAALDAVLAENMSSLREYDYFTRILSGQARIENAKAEDASSRVVDKRLEMTFRLILPEPLSVADLPMRYAVYDPSYYIEMVHAEAPDAVALVNAPGNCNSELKQPTPDAEQVVLAASLDQTQKGPAELGQYFAEEVAVKCG